jgi:hypothetical protein
MMLKKATVFESDTAHLERDELKAKLRPTEDTWANYCRIIPAWDETIAKVADKDLPNEEYKLLEDFVEWQWARR